MTEQTMAARIQEIKATLRALRAQRTEAEYASIDASSRVEKGEWTIEQAQEIWDRVTALKAQMQALQDEKLNLELKIEMA